MKGKSKCKSEKSQKPAPETFDYTCINSKYTESKFKKRFNDCWRNAGPNVKDEDPNGVDIMKDPFNCAFLPDVFTDTQLLHDATAALNDLNFRTLNNDLYKFKTTGVLPSECGPSLIKMCEILRGPVKQWVTDLCGIELNDFVSINCSKYKFSDMLLCHDDELECRRIAFILYLTPDWKSEYGGTLDLFSVDEQGKPKTIEKRIVPQFNGFSFFEVSPSSYHQVSEILTKRETRISINGWFHGAPIQFPTRRGPKTPIYRTPGHTEERVIYSWINPLYLEQMIQSDVRQEFQEKSEIQLPDFLKRNKYLELSESMKTSNLPWQFVGPPFKRHYEVVFGSKVPKIVGEFVTLLQSEAMVVILSQLTGLRLHPLAPPDENEESNDDEDRLSSCSDEGVVAKTEGTSSSSTTSRCYNDSRSYSSSSSSSSEHDEGNGSTTNKRRRSRKSKKNVKRLKTITNETTLSQPWISDTEEESSLPRQSDVDEEAISEITTEIRRWRWGSYSLMRDDDLTSTSDFTLDAAFFCNGTQRWNQKFGGDSIYVAKGETQQLLTVIPKPNTLALVYRDAQTFKFTKYINAKSTSLNPIKATFHEVYCQYRERRK